jgi:hypothetical protein
MPGRHAKAQISSATSLRSESTADRAPFSSSSEMIDENFQQDRYQRESTAGEEFLLCLGDTVRRIEKHSSGKLSPADAAHIRRVILEQYRSVMKNLAGGKSTGR